VKKAKRKTRPSQTSGEIGKRKIDREIRRMEKIYVISTGGGASAAAVERPCISPRSPQNPEEISNSATLLIKSTQSPT
jgi:hypothetical protein